MGDSTSSKLKTIATSRANRRGTAPIKSDDAMAAAAIRKLGTVSATRRVRPWSASFASTKPFVSPVADTSTCRKSASAPSVCLAANGCPRRTRRSLRRRGERRGSGPELGETAKWRGRSGRHRAMRATPAKPDRRRQFSMQGGAVTAIRRCLGRFPPVFAPVRVTAPIRLHPVRQSGSGGGKSRVRRFLRTRRLPPLARRCREWREPAPAPARLASCPLEKAGRADRSRSIEVAEGRG